ncbi:EFR1 family ferrodoxin [Desulfosporosinus sp.]|uniref:EFR1 family ferrodoxin n=1 Tax=Desulfosporosinus sp. TaxID=157907 RepID=UPI00231DFA10|nr:EFR1 family ferrodoxin [Desulfosporosinus sp.]MDA8221658.1 EFR1 family ferrodoxin [Desulfitobacterium hafniense]
MKVFYFTATGNSLDVAKRFGGEIYSIPNVLRGNQFHFEDEKIGLIFPCYGFAAPKIVREFIEKITLKSPYIFVIMTYGNKLAGGVNWFVRYAEENNIHVQYADGLLMIDNYLPLFNIEKQKMKKKYTEENLSRLLNDVNQTKRYIRNRSFTDSMLTKGIQYFVKRNPNFNTDKDFSVGNDCNQCGTCVKVCPRNNIKLDEHKPAYGGNCEFCLACINLCPQKAIRLKKESNPNARYLNENVTLKEIIAANN